MKEFLYVILLNTSVFMVSFFSLKLYDKRMGKDSVGGLKITYIISLAASAYITHSGLAANGMPRDYKTVLFTILVCMFPVAAMVNCGYAISVFLRGAVEKIRGKKEENKKEEKTVSVIKSKRAKKR